MEPTILEPWLHNIIRKKLATEAEFRRWMGRETLAQVTRDDVNRYHLFLFKKTLNYATEKSVFYRDLLKKAGINADDIRSMADIAKVPFTTPEDIAQHPYYFACISLGEIERVTTFTSSGTTGPQKKVFVNDHDLERMTDFMAAGMMTVAKEGDVVQIMLPSRRPNDQSDLLSQGVKKMGGTPVVTGTSPISEDQIQKIDEFHPAVLFASVSRMWRITQETYHQHDLKTKGVKTLFVTSEYLSESMRRQLQNIWNCDVHAHYGMTEMGLGVAVECHAHDGFHYNEADLMVEVIDPKTGEVLGDDAEGELVFTALNREAMPLIRYRTHDLSRLVGNPCKCGASTLRKFAPITRRRESIVKICSDELYPSAFDELLFSIPDVIDYQVTLNKEKKKDNLTFKIEVVEPDEGIRQIISENLLNHPIIRKSLDGNILVLSPIELVSRGKLTRMNRAKKLIIDVR
jgi:phenylacetate-coenzyme A ligase PaaK-like adenylate-forming protein